ncbi:mitochondrial ribonuclease P protein 3 [Copidosoma floridanum]|uniref:mitochondrial ribonuclease P protein 3 n=1 Tax=Copidosoma floridanum TaxID=29053 RepID=UPI0006C9582F|nr:mitochondrial ribonuclease P protein 3 [Copidosoma floridanum]
MKLLIRTSVFVMQCTKRRFSNAPLQSATGIENTKRLKNRFIIKYFTQSDSSINETLRDQHSVIKDKHWKEMRAELLNNFELTDFSVDAQLIELVNFYKRPEAVLDYIKFLKKNDYDINLNLINKYFKSYYSRKKPLTPEEEEEIFKLYDDIRKKYHLLDATTCESCILALSLTQRWKESIELLDIIKFSSSPGLLVYTAIISAAFKNNEHDIGMMYLNLTMPKSPIHPDSLLAYLDYCQRNLKGHKLQQSLEKMFLFWREHSLIPIQSVVQAYCNVYESFQHIANTAVVARSGVCSSCYTTLPQTTLTSAEFKMLSVSVLKNVIIGENMFCSTSPQELKKYLLFIQTLKPYDVVIDGLNVAYSTKRENIQQKGSLQTILNVVNDFVRQNKRVLIIGRAHMMWWCKEVMNKIQQKADVYLVKNISEDDPFLLHVTLVSGPQTYFVSRDLMRSHKFKLDPSIQNLFKRWQLSRQYLYKSDAKKLRLHLLPPILFDVSTQQNENGWHIPFVQSNHLIQPDIYKQPDHWICLKKIEKTTAKK